MGGSRPFGFKFLRGVIHYSNEEVARDGIYWHGFNSEKEGTIKSSAQNIRLC
jgi:hypothetical protein